MVCMSSNALAPRVLRTGARIAGRLGAQWYAVYVETPRENARTDSAGRLARRCGRTSRSPKASARRSSRVHAERPADGLIAFAQREGITHVIFGQSARTRLEILWRGSTLNRFLEEVRDAAVQVVPFEGPM